jgi:hypothetical protein
MFTALGSDVWRRPLQQKPKKTISAQSESLQVNTVERHQTEWMAMNIFKAPLIIAALSTAMSPAFAQSHFDYMKQVATYKPMAAFNHVVGDVRFVGYFLAGPQRCDVSVFVAPAKDAPLPDPPRRMILQIAAGGRSELGVGPGAALAIACTADADAIKIASQVDMRTLD